MEVVNRIKLSILTMILLILIYALIMMYLEGLSFINALYFSIVTISTVGYGDITPTTELGKIISSIYILCGVSIGLYALGNIAEFFVSGYFKKTDRMRKMENRIKKLKDHYIICGYGKCGKVITKKLEKSGVNYVVIDINEKILEKELENNPNFNYIVGDATHDEVLIKAGIDRAKGLISAVSRDSDNVYITLSAKRLNPNIFVVAKAEEKVSMDKLLIAGADRVVSPYIIGGLRMAALALKVDILDFVSTFMSIARYEYDEDLEIRKIEVKSNSPLVDKKLYESRIREKFGANIIGIKKRDKLVINPSADTEISSGDIIYAFGTGEQLDNLERVARGLFNNSNDQI